MVPHTVQRRNYYVEAGKWDKGNDYETIWDKVAARSTSGMPDATSQGSNDITALPALQDNVYCRGKTASAVIMVKAADACMGAYMTAVGHEVRILPCVRFKSNGTPPHAETGEGGAVTQRAAVPSSVQGVTG